MTNGRLPVPESISIGCCVLCHWPLPMIGRLRSQLLGYFAFKVCKDEVAGSSCPGVDRVTIDQLLGQAFEFELCHEVIKAKIDNNLLTSSLCLLKSSLFLLALVSPCLHLQPHL